MSENKRFKKPTIEEVKKHLEDINCYSVNPEAFVAFYESKDWKVGKNKMKNWKAAITTWRIRAEERGKYRRGGIPL